MDNINNNNKTNDLIGSVHSFSGEPSQSLKDMLLVPFKRTQTKTVVEQFKSGVRLFDLHVRYNTKFKKFYPSAGYWSTGKALLQLMSELNKEVQLANTKIYYILTLDNEIDKENTDSLDIVAKFNTLSNSLNAFFKNCDLIEKRISPKQEWYNRIFNDIKTEQLWKDQENSDIEWTDPVPTHFMPLLRYNIKKCYNYIYKKIKHQETEEQPIYGIDGMYVLKEFV